MSSGTTSRPSVPPWVEKRLEKLEDGKSDRGVMKSEIKRIEERIDDVEDRAGAIHPCMQDGDIREMRGSLAVTAEAVRSNTEEIKTVYRWYVRGLAALILVLLTSGFGFVWYLGGMAFHLEAQGKALEKMESRINQSPTKEQLRSTEKLLEDVANRAATKTANQVVQDLNGESSSR